MGDNQKSSCSEVRWWHCWLWIPQILGNIFIVSWLASYSLTCIVLQSSLMTRCIREKPSLVVRLEIFSQKCDQNYFRPFFYLKTLRLFFCLDKIPPHPHWNKCWIYFSFFLSSSFSSHIYTFYCIYNFILIYVCICIIYLSQIMCI